MAANLAILCLGFASTPNEPATPITVTTDHYLAATVDTVSWGIYDLDKPASMTMKSGETVTVEVVTHHGGHDYAKMIKGDPEVEKIYEWIKGQSLTEKAVPKTGGSGVHICTGPIEVEGAEPGDYVQVEILELEPRPNPGMGGRTFGTNSQKFAGYQFRIGKEDGSAYATRNGSVWATGTGDGVQEAITVFEFIKAGDKMAWAKPVYMYGFPTLVDPGGTLRSYDGMPGVVIPHVYNYGYGMSPIGGEVEYPAGFDGTEIVSDGSGNPGVINYLDVALDWKVPLRPHLGIMAVMPANTDNYENSKPGVGGANTIPPSQFGGNIDNWRIGKGATMYYKVEVAGAKIVVGDTHAAQGDSELAGTAMETSLTAKLKVTLHKADALPQLVTTLTGPLLETYDSFVITGYAIPDYLTTLESNPSSIFSEGASVDSALADAFKKTRTFMMNYFEVSEEESIAIMATSVEFGITQIVDGNWGVHAVVPKWVFDSTDHPYDYKCTPNPDGTPGRRLQDTRRARELEALGVKESDIAEEFFHRVAGSDVEEKPAYALLEDKWLGAKIKFLNQRLHPDKEPIPSAIKKALVKSGALQSRGPPEHVAPEKIELFSQGLI